MDFVTELVNSLRNLPDRQVKFLEEFKVQKNCEIFPFHHFILLSNSGLPLIPLYNEQLILIFP